MTAYSLGQNNTRFGEVRQIGQEEKSNKCGAKRDDRIDDESERDHSASVR